MQHYSLARDIEIAVIDGQRRFGNNYCFPAGPLREPKNRIFKADLIVSKYNARTCEHKMDYTYNQLVSLNELSKTIPVSDLHGMTVHAIAGINNPDYLAIEISSIKNNKNKIKEELGDLIFATLDVSRKLKLDPELILKNANKKFVLIDTSKFFILLS